MDKNCSILVVDDDPNIRETVAEILDEEGYPVETACNGVEALEMVQQRAPCVVLLDMRMPVLDGWGFVQAVRERTLKMQIVVMTAAQDAQAWAREVQAAGFVAKPFDLYDLLGKVERLCAKAAQNHA